MLRAVRAGGTCPTDRHRGVPGVAPEVVPGMPRPAAVRLPLEQPTQSLGTHLLRQMPDRPPVRPVRQTIARRRSLRDVPGAKPGVPAGAIRRTRGGRPVQAVRLRRPHFERPLQAHPRGEDRIRQLHHMRPGPRNCEPPVSTVPGSGRRSEPGETGCSIIRATPGRARHWGRPARIGPIRRGQGTGRHRRRSRAPQGLSIRRPPARRRGAPGRSRSGAADHPPATRGVFPTERTG